MSYIMVDIEADGPIPGGYSMICFGAVLVEPALDRSFYGKLKPISEKWLPDALKVSGFSREETLAFDEPRAVMTRFEDWLGENVRDRPIFISDNNGFDWQFINWYFHHFVGRTRSGSARRIWARSIRGWSKTPSPPSSICGGRGTRITQSMTRRGMPKRSFT